MSRSAIESLIQAFPDYLIKECSLEETVASDIVTYSFFTNGVRDGVIPGTHLNAIGADAEGKEELEPNILKRATVVVDDLKQASVAGEINIPLR